LLNVKPVGASLNQKVLKVNLVLLVCVSRTAQSETVHDTDTNRTGLIRGHMTEQFYNEAF
jgi:hypothetical protein